MQAGDRQHMSDPSPRERLAQVLVDTSFIANDERAQNGSGLGIEVGIKECANSPASLFDPAANTVAVRTYALNRRVIPEECGKINPLPSQVALVVRAARPVDVEGRTQLEREMKQITV